MVFHPAIIALLLSSLFIAGLVLYSARIGLTILARWDLTSGSELQLELERKTYLVSTVLSYAFGFQVVSLFLYIFTADNLHTQFVGAMCAAGTLYVSSYGYPTLILKTVTFLLAGLWLILNYADNRAYDYPLVRTKYWMLLLLTPVILAEVFLQGSYLLSLEPNVITSCCGSLFTSDTAGVSTEITGLPRVPMQVAFYGCMALTCGSGLYFYFRGKLGYALSLHSLVTLAVSVASLISFISLYVYELPTHHCPFDILQRAYGYVGYPLYFFLGAGALAGMGVGALMPFRRKESLKRALPAIQRKLALVATVSFFLFASIATCQILFSDLTLG